MEEPISGEDYSICLLTLPDEGLHSMKNSLFSMSFPECTKMLNMWFRKNPHPDKCTVV